MPLTMAMAGSVRLGCQTNAWRIQPGDFGQFLAVLDKVKGYRYDGFETGFRNVETRFAEATAARAELAKRRLVFLGCHIFLLEYDKATSLPPADLVERVITGAAALGAERVILSGASVGANRAAQKRKAEALQRHGDLCRKAGLRGVAYHNHDREFVDGAGEIEALLADTAGGAVQLVMDAGHAWLARADVPAFFTKHAGRIDGMHLRDFQDREQVPLGQGVFPLVALAGAVRARRWAGWVINEEERLNDVKPGDTAVGPARKRMREVFGR
ncbi:MAG: sugar phosphate isomerase/epimerase [Bryobacterales bacterium]|nr:sugar phosphate isomerase/epimerase [Bryobacterales bacterium]